MFLFLYIKQKKMLPKNKVLKQIRNHPLVMISTHFGKKKDYLMAIFESSYLDFFILIRIHALKIQIFQFQSFNRPSLVIT